MVSNVCEAGETLVLCPSYMQTWWISDVLYSGALIGLCPSTVLSMNPKPLCVVIFEAFSCIDFSCKSQCSWVEGYVFMKWRGILLNPQHSQHAGEAAVSK